MRALVLCSLFAGSPLPAADAARAGAAPFPIEDGVLFTGGSDASTAIWRNRIVVPGGEARQGVRSTAVWAAMR